MSKRLPAALTTPRLQSRRRTALHSVQRRGDEHDADALHVLLTVDDAAELLRTTRRAIYAMVERQQLPAVIRIGRRVLFRTSELLDWLDQKRAPSLQE
jgi:excisionase family DNA binding protein